MKILSDYLKEAPEFSGVYRMVGEGCEVLYVGKAKNVRKRLGSYAKFRDLSNRLKQMVSQIKKIEVVRTDSEIEALILELNFIKTLKPKYNILLRDDKTFPYIAFSLQDDFPRIFKVRVNDKKDISPLRQNTLLEGKSKSLILGRGSEVENFEQREEDSLDPLPKSEILTSPQGGGCSKSGGDKLFGPYSGAYDLRSTLDVLKKVFLLRGCSNREFASRKKPCLEYQIKRCSAPCVGKITKKEYKINLQNALDFLDGKSDVVRGELQAKMNEESANLNFERAVIYRDRIRALANITAKQEVAGEALRNSDILALQRSGGGIIIEHFIFRNGFNHGNQHFFPKNSNDLSDGEVLSGFIKEYYNTNNLPAEFISNVAIYENELLGQAFLEYYNKKTIFTVPKSGKKKQLLKFVEKNAVFNLEHKILSKKSNLRLHKKLQEVFKLADIPDRIDVFDNSHLSGKFEVGAMIVSSLTGFEKKLYRKYEIKQNLPLEGRSQALPAGGGLKVDDFRDKEEDSLDPLPKSEILTSPQGGGFGAGGGDDYAMLREVLSRRYLRAKKEQDLPDLIIIDGGKGQATIAAKVLSELELEIPFFCIAKGKDRNAGKERFCNNFTDYFSIEDVDALFYLQRIRDEVHRFVINFNRQKRKKAVLKSELDGIKGIGAKKKNALLQYFGSVRLIKAASIEDIAKAEGIGLELAKIVKESLR